METECWKLTKLVTMGEQEDVFLTALELSLKPSAREGVLHLLQLVFAILGSLALHAQQLHVEMGWWLDLKFVMMGDLEDVSLIVQGSKQTTLVLLEVTFQHQVVLVCLAILYLQSIAL